jgi:hypothetical protein
MIGRWTLIALACAGACRPLPGGASATGDDASSTVAPADRDGPRSQVQVTWRLFETLHWLDGQGPHESAIFELLVDGGTPARVQLGRRDSSGCVVRGGVEGAATLPGLHCSFAGADVRRAAGGELRVEAFDLHATRPDRPLARRNGETATVHVPADADVTVSRELARIPDEAVPGTRVP